MPSKIKLGKSKKKILKYLRKISELDIKPIMYIIKDSMPHIKIDELHKILNDELADGLKEHYQFLKGKSSAHKNNKHPSESSTRRVGKTN